MQGKWFGLAVMVVVLSANVGHLTVEGSGAPGSVALFSARDGNNEIYVMDQDGGQPRRITENPFSDVDPDISTNGQDIVFTSNRAGNSDLWYAMRDSPEDSFGAPLPVPGFSDPGYVEAEAFVTPDGCELFFVSDRQDLLQWDIYHAVSVR